MEYNHMKENESDTAKGNNCNVELISRVNRPESSFLEVEKQETTTKERAVFALLILLVVVRRMSGRFGMREVGEDDDWTLFWTDRFRKLETKSDSADALERCKKMKSYQKINHFPGMNALWCKDLLAKNMNRLLKQFPNDYLIFPTSWCLPDDYEDFQIYCRENTNRTYILKPSSSNEGKGIFITKDPKEVKAVGEHHVCQLYIINPFLIDGFKFDFRMYVLVTSCDPLRIFVYKDGLARFATIKYNEPKNNNVNEVCMHLTNYAINKHSRNFNLDEQTGSKRRISTINRWLMNSGYDVESMWKDIEDSIIKTLIAAYQSLKNSYNLCFPNHNGGSACFEVLGFDVMLDEKLKPWVIEVNESPCFQTGSVMDREIKEGLLFDALNLLNFTTCKRSRYFEDQVRHKMMAKNTEIEDADGSRCDYLNWLTTYEDTHTGGYRRIYPNDNEDEYAKYFG